VCPLKILLNVTYIEPAQHHLLAVSEYQVGGIGLEPTTCRFLKGKPAGSDIIKFEIPIKFLINK